MTRKIRRMLARAALIGVALAGACSAPDDAATSDPGASRTADGVDFDFTRMNATMKTTYAYRLAANPAEFEGRTLRISGTFLTQVDEARGERCFGCLVDAFGGCSCCASGVVLEFTPKSSYAWPTNFPPAESRVVVSGRLAMFEVVASGRSCSVPRLVDADVQKVRRER